MLHGFFNPRIFAENLKRMELSQAKKEKILRNAEILLLKTQLLIETCDGWLPAEEGNKNMERKILERKKMSAESGQLPEKRPATETSNEVRTETIRSRCRIRKNSLTGKKPWKLKTENYYNVLQLNF